MTPYSRPLSLPHREIRCIILQPLSLGPQIQCAIETISLLTHPSYEALSYVWGDPSIRGTIIFNSIPFSVTHNLALALQHLRLPDRPRRLWVDALCINQADTKERNEQVSLMGEIYSMASPVVVWLGESFDGCVEAFDLMSKVVSVDESEITEEMSSIMFSFYIQLAEREWFTRLWTIQELVLANKDPLVGCGFTWTTWSILLKAWQRVAMIEFTRMGMTMKKEGVESENGGKKSDSDAFSLGVRTSGTKIDLLSNLRTAVTSKKGSDLRDLLLNTVSSKATEPKDRIYALLGMLHASDRVTLTIDYSLSLGTIYASAISHIFQKGTGPFLLSGMELAGPHPSPQYSFFPSWVPRLGSASLTHPTLFHPPGIGVSGAGSTAINGHISPDLKTLSIRGLPIDTILEKFTFGPNNSCLSQLADVETLVHKAQHLSTLHFSQRPYLHIFKTKEPVWRTLITNKAYSGAAHEVAPESYGEMYEKLLNKNKQEHNTSFQNNDTSQDPNNPNPDEKSRDYKLALLNHLPNTTFFITTTGFYGVAPSSPNPIETGDQIAIWFGAPAPFVLRRTSQRSYNETQEDDGKEIERQGSEEREELFTTIGVAYIAGIMNGEMVDEVYCENLEDDVVFTVQ